MPRMWGVPPAVLCRRHLMGEHHEMHVFMGRIRKRMPVSQYTSNGYLYLPALLRRHEDLVSEIYARGFKHESPPQICQLDLDLYIEDLPPGHGLGYVDLSFSVETLRGRCQECFDKIALEFGSQKDFGVWGDLRSPAPAVS